VALVGGKVVDEKMLVALMVGIGREDVRVAFEIDGQRIAADFPGEYPDWPEGFDTRRIKVQQTGDKGPAALWSVYLSRRDLKTALRTIRESGLLLAGLGGLVALILGLWIARRLSKPLEELASAAGEVAAGRRDLVVRERGGADELAVLVRSFNVMTDELAAGEERLKQSERIAAWREIAKRIAHEIKNPLTPIQLNIEMLQRGYRDNPDSVDKQYREVIESTLYEVGRVKRIVDEFSHFARMPAPVLTTTCLGELIDSTIALHREVSGEVRLSRSGLPKLQASVDPDQMRQVLTNLIKNAIEAVDSDKDRADPGCVDVGLEVQANQSVAVITVADTGPGIPEEVRERLFTPYFTTKTLGTGLGLAIVHRIVAEHGGEISVSQRAEGGTCFVVRLPVSAS
jgi:nitrogen fixation/metabolism regulation signal transduction histidine kinase